MFVTVEEVDRTIIVQLTEKMTPPTAFQLGRHRQNIGENILNLANSGYYQNFTKRKLYGSFFDVDEETYTAVTEELLLNLQSLQAEANHLKEKCAKSDDFPLGIPYTFEQDEGDGYYSPMKPLFLKSAFDLNLSQSVLYTSRQIFEIDTFRQAVAIEFILYLKAYREGKVQAIKQCDTCGRYFRATVRFDRKYCSNACRDKNHLEQIEKNPYAKKYRHLYQNVSKDLSELPADDPLRAIYKKWRKLAKQESCMDTREVEYCSADEYGTTMRKKWNQMKGDLK